MNFREYIASHNVIADGAFGTYYAEKYQTPEVPELANTLHKERVKEIHCEYLASGASVIRTNTFASNTIALQRDFSYVRENITEAIDHARKAVGRYEKDHLHRFIAGDIGPIRAGSGMTDQEAEQEYDAIVRVFAEKGISIINFETFSSLESITPVIERIKTEYDLFIIVSFAVDQAGYSSAGLSAKHLISDACSIPAIDAVGLNCDIGPSHMYDILKEIELPKGKILSAIPNAGYPILSRNQLQFNSHPFYFAEKTKELLSVGVDMVGGCCGTSPDFIKRLSAIVEASPKLIKAQAHDCLAKTTPPKRNGFLYDASGKRKNKKFIAVELAPPFNADDEKLLESAHILKNSGVDVLTFPDSPSGRTRVDSVLMAEKVYNETGMTVMPHICCRDKNALAMRSLLMGAKINNINHFLVITGDPVPSAVSRTVKSVFNFSSVGLMKIIQEMNKEVFAGQPLNYGGAINQNRRNLDSVIEQTKRKMDAGADFFLTQPVFTKEDAERIRIVKEKTGACIFCGIMPLVSRKNALFMKNEIAGVNVTDEIVARYPEQASKEENETIGIALAKEIITYVTDFADGYYFSFPFNRVYLLPKIMENCDSNQSDR